MDLAEALIATLLDGGISPREAAWTGWGMIYFILWPAQEEQALPDRSGTDDLAVGERPALKIVLLFLAERSFDERFEFGVAKMPA